MSWVNLDSKSASGILGTEIANECAMILGAVFHESRENSAGQTGKFLVYREFQGSQDCETGEGSPRLNPLRNSSWQ
jgi:hypothetical protein